jgi:hypothetical protein
LNRFFDRLVYIAKGFIKVGQGEAPNFYIFYYYFFGYLGHYFFIRFHQKSSLDCGMLPNRGNFAGLIIWGSAYRKKAVLLQAGTPVRRTWKALPLSKIPVAQGEIKDFSE